jgi:hypothetical protein
VGKTIMATALAHDLTVAVFTPKTLRSHQS